MIKVGNFSFKEAKIQEMGGLETTEAVEAESTVSACHLPNLSEALGVSTEIGCGLVIGLRL